MLKQFDVALLGQTFTRQDQRRALRGYRPSRRNAAWQAALQEAHETGSFATCLCLEPQDGLRRLAIKKSRGGLLHLARYPETEREHSPYCHYSHSEKKRPSASAPQTPQISSTQEPELPELVAPNLDQFSPEAMNALISVTPDTEPTYNLAWKGAECAVRPDQGQWDTCHFNSILPELWRLSGLTSYTGSANLTRGQTAGVLARAANNLLVNDQPLGSFLLLYTSEHFEHRRGRNAGVVENCISTGSEIWAVTFLPRYNPEKHEKPRLLPVTGFHGMPLITVSHDMWDAALAAHPAAASAWRHGYTVVMLVRASSVEQPARRSTPRAHALDVSLLIVTPEMIPVFSGPEYKLAQRLVAENRNFFKHLPLDSRADQYGTYTPTFTLSDTQPHAPLVLLVPQESSQKRHERTAYFSNLYPGRWVQWEYGDSLTKPLPDKGESAK